MQPSKGCRVSIHNQIYTTKYYVVTERENGKRGGWVSTGGRWGMRGKGNALGVSFGEACSLAGGFNRSLGWGVDMRV